MKMPLMSYLKRRTAFYLCVHTVLVKSPYVQIQIWQLGQRGRHDDRRLMFSTLIKQGLYWSLNETFLLDYLSSES